MINRDKREDFSDWGQTIHSRHDTTPTAEHIDGPHRAPYPDETEGEFEYLALRIEGNEYAIPVTNLVGASSDELWDVDRVVWADSRIMLEAHQDDDAELLIEGGMTQREHPHFERAKGTTEHIDDPDEILWERPD